MKSPTLSKHLINWYHQHGRHDLPWQKNPTPYRVWVSEIMLQQTQVTTVIAYYQRFIKRFPSIRALAKATEDEVLSHWSGLGYYARARNLHKASRIILKEHNGHFPATLDKAVSLPGIGKSTAGAILSFSKKQFAVILDGNVKRVLTRVFAIEKPIEKTQTINDLWELATKLTPEDQAHYYNQAIMDLGATVCTRTKPKCEICPFSSFCKGYQANKPTQFPVKTPKKARPVKQTRMLIIQNKENQILLIKRPKQGIWGGLWSFPECEPTGDHTSWSSMRLEHHQDLALIKHQFTHYILEITPTRLFTKTAEPLASSTFIWYTLTDKLPGGIATPVANILNHLRSAL